MMNISFGYENPIKTRLGEDFFKEIPLEAGVYFFLDHKREPLYIGKADSLRKRLASYKLAKPGTVAEHILEMIEHAREIVWETHPTGAAALKRESELIRSIQPPFNIAGTMQLPFLSCGLKVAKESSRSKPEKKVVTEFRLSHDLLPKEFERFGCFSHRGRTKAGYSALLRLLTAASTERDRFNLPAKLCRTSPAYVHAMELPDVLVKPLRQFLAGESVDLLHALTKRLLEKDNLQPHLYAPLQRDLNAAREFFASGPQATRAHAKRLKPDSRRVSLTQREMERATLEQSRQALVELRLPQRAEPMRMTNKS